MKPARTPAVQCMCRVSFSLHSNSLQLAVMRVEVLVDGKARQAATEDKPGVGRVQSPLGPHEDSERNAPRQKACDANKPEPRRAVVKPCKPLAVGALAGHAPCREISPPRETNPVVAVWTYPHSVRKL